MPEKKELDLKELEESVLSAIDKLFSEERPEEEKKEILQLEEAILSLDWEFSAEQLNKLQKTIQQLKTVYTDKFNKVLLTMMENIAKFLATSKEYAPPDTLTILAKIARIFKEGNTQGLSPQDKKIKFNEAYTLFMKLKGDIANIKAKKLLEKPQAGVTLPQKEAEEKTALQPEIPPAEEAVFVEKKEFDTRLADLQKGLERIQFQLTTIEQFKSEIKSEIDGLKQKIAEIESRLILQEMAEKTTKETREEKPEETEETLEMLPYVMVFSFGSEKIAVPVDNIANIYSISPKKAARLQEKDIIFLKELKGFWGKLKKNMKGELKNLKEKELEKMEVPVLKIALNGKAEKKVLKNAILMQESGKYSILFVGDFVSKKLYLPESSERIDKEGIKARVEIPECGMAYLINPKE